MGQIKASPETFLSEDVSLVVVTKQVQVSEAGFSYNLLVVDPSFVQTRRAARVVDPGVVSMDSRVQHILKYGYDLMSCSKL